jgi:hypothetical protein
MPAKANLVVRHYIKANRLSTPLGLGQFRKQKEARSAKAAQSNISNVDGTQDRVLGS